jgi:hypothetical protein
VLGREDWRSHSRQSGAGVWAMTGGSLAGPTSCREHLAPAPHCGERITRGDRESVPQHVRVWTSSTGSDLSSSFPVWVGEPGDGTRPRVGEDWVHDASRSLMGAKPRVAPRGVWQCWVASRLPVVVCPSLCSGEYGAGHLLAGASRGVHLCQMES